LAKSRRERRENGKISQEDGYRTSKRNLVLLRWEAIKKGSGGHGEEIAKKEKEDSARTENRWQIDTDSNVTFSRRSSCIQPSLDYLKGERCGRFLIITGKMRRKNTRTKKRGPFPTI